MGNAVNRGSIAEFERQLDEFRNPWPRGRKLPDSVWQAAVEPLRLDYMGLKKRIGGVSPLRDKMPCRVTKSTVPLALSQPARQAAGPTCSASQLSVFRNKPEGF
jgi:hypothetical protein